MNTMQGVEEVLVSSNTAGDPTSQYSVVVPFYNAEKTIGSAIEAIMRLRPAPVATYLIDDASTDRSSEIARRFPQCTIVSLDVNRGPGYARNVGARLAATEMILFLDSDCYIDEAPFPAAYQRFQDELKLAGVMGIPFHRTPSGPFAGTFKNYWYHLEFTAWGNPPPTLYGSCFFIRRDAYLAVGGFDESFCRMPCEDNEFYFRLVEAGYRFERKMDFTFVHDKSLTLVQLLRTSFERSASIIRNQNGTLGTRGMTWGPSEQLLWGLEIGAGFLSVTIGFVVVCALILSSLSPSLGTSLVPAATIGLLLSLGVFFAIIREKLLTARRQMGLAFAAKAFFYRMLEMVPVVLGIMWGFTSPKLEFSARAGRSRS
jgi:GT2 family glycosyltransferase